MDYEENNEQIVMNKSKRKLIKLSIVIGILMVVLLTIFFKGYSNAKGKYEIVIKELQEKIDNLSDPIATYTLATKEVTIDLIKSEIRDIGEIATIEYLYTDAGKFENPKQLLGLNLPFTTKSFIAKWDGIIKAGVQIDKIIVEINDVNKEIIVHMPKSVILSHEIEEESIETLDEKAGLFNPVKVSDVREFDKVSKEAMEERAIENGILDKASKNAKEIIEKLINNDVVQEQGYTIKFKIIE